MIDENNWRCTICDYKGKFGQGNTVGVHMNGATHIQTMKNKNVAGAGGSQLTIAASLAKGIRSGTAEYPPSYIPKPNDIPHHVLLNYMENNICHGFYNNSLVINNEMVDCSLLLNDLHVGTLWYPDPHYSQHIEKNGKTLHIKGTFRHVDCSIIFCNMCPLIPTLADFEKRAWRSRDMVVPRGERFIQSGTHLDYLQREELITSARE